MAKKPQSDPIPPPPPIVGAPARVRATQLGFYGQRRRPGDVFDLIHPEQDFSPVWMVDAGDVPVQTASPADARRREHAAIMAGETPTLQKNAADLELDDEPTGTQSVI